jgi:hypothetical protein
MDNGNAGWWSGSHDHQQVKGERSSNATSPKVVELDGQASLSSAITPQVMSPRVRNSHRMGVLDGGHVRRQHRVRAGIA